VVSSPSVGSASVSISCIKIPSFMSALMTDDAKLSRALLRASEERVESGTLGWEGPGLWLWMLRFERDGEGFNAGGTSSLDGYGLARDIVLDRGICIIERGLW